MKRVGRYTIVFPERPAIKSYAAFVGKKEKEGPLGEWFKNFSDDTSLAQESWEKAESELQKKAFELARQHAGIQSDEVDIMFGGDLLNQCIATGYASREAGVPFAGLYGACSTMAESLALAAAFVDGEYAKTAAAITSSHFCSAERQFRFPLEYGGFRAPVSQWTVTGAGCVLVGRGDTGGIRVDKMCIGVVEDLGVNDINNMGCAMAPAAAETLRRFLRDTETKPEDYAAVVTGDLGEIGSGVFRELSEKNGFAVDNHLDCGKLIYDRDSQNVCAGGSGCGCCASVLTGYLLPLMERKELGDILFIATGALMSTTSFQQGESIPSVAHLVHLVPEK